MEKTAKEKKERDAHTHRAEHGSTANNNQMVLVQAFSHKAAVHSLGHLGDGGGDGGVELFLVEGGEGRRKPGGYGIGRAGLGGREGGVLPGTTEDAAVGLAEAMVQDKAWTHDLLVYVEEEVSWDISAVDLRREMRRAGPGASERQS